MITTSDLTHRELTHVAAGWLLQQPTTNLCSWEMRYQRSVFDVIGVSTRGNTQDKRITVCEVKRSRNDLLADLNKGKLLKYEKQSTHCYLLATEEALRLNKGLNTSDVLTDLLDRDLPTYWGIGVFTSSNSEPLGMSVRVLRACKRHRPTHSGQLASLTGKISQVNTWRLFTNEGIVPAYSR